MPTEQSEVKYGVWYIPEKRWARLDLPEPLMSKYGQMRCDKPKQIFFPLEEAQFLLDGAFLIAQNRRNFCIRPSTYTGFTPEEQAAEEDRKRRIEHANKYL